MLHKFMHVFIGLSLTVLFSAQAASAVSFGQMDVASHLGEPFYAEMPLELGAGETLAKTSVELGGTSDYRILEVYRNQILNAIRVDIVDDERGTRAVLSSEAAIDAAFFNVVLKVRYGRSTHFKKIPVFLEIANRGASADKKSVPVQMAPPISSATVVPETSNAFIAKAPVDLLYPNLDEEAELDALNVDVEEPVAEPAFQAYEGWARTSRYGPMVFGDTITTVAKRLRVDDQFTNQQVMVALYEKNREQFDKDNINLIKANTYLNVPTAAEVSRISHAQAMQTLTDQDKTWRAMQSQSKYAAIAQAQKTRYTSRVRMGQATAAQATPTAAASPTAIENKAPAAMPANNEVMSPAAQPVNNEALNVLAEEKQALAEALNEKESSLSAVQQKLAEMQQRLDAAESKAADLEKKVAQVPATPADSAAIEAQNKRLELMISRLKNELEQSKANAGQAQGAADWVMYVLAGLGLLVLGLLAAVVMLMRRKPEHPADKDLEETGSIEAFDEDSVSTKIMSADDFDLAMADAEASANKETPKTSEDSFDPFEDQGLDDIPELTDEDTGEIEAFNPEQDEIPDPSVNYLEEADVYLRYGMEDEAEKQVKMALKLNNEDPLAHAKLVQLRLAKGDDSGAAELSTAAKAVLTGAALLTFENAIAGENVAAPEMDASSPNTSLADLNAPDALTDTGMVDFGEINFDDSGVDKTVPVEEDDASAVSDDFDFDFSEMGNHEAGAEKETTSADADALFEAQSESTDGFDFDFGDFNVSTELKAEENGSEDELENLVADSSLSDDGDLDFTFSDFDVDKQDADESALDLEATTVGEAFSMPSDEPLATPADELDTGSFDFGMDELTSEHEVEDAMVDSIGLESLDFNISELEDMGDASTETDASASDAPVADELSFESSDDESHAAMEDSIGLESLDFNINDLDDMNLSDAAGTSASDVAIEDDLLEEEASSSSDEDFAIEGEDDATHSAMDESIGLESLDFSLDDMADIEDENDTVADLVVDGAEIDADAVAVADDASEDLHLSSLNHDTGMDTSDLENLTIDFSNMDMSSFGGMDAVEEKNDVADLLDDEAVAGTAQHDESIDLSNFDMPDFASDFDNDDLSISEMGDDFDLDGTTMIADGNETVVLHHDEHGFEDERNDYEVEKAQRIADEEANASMVELDMEADDPFAVANSQLKDADSEKLSDEWLNDGLNDSLDDMVGLKVDELSLAEKVVDVDDASAIVEDLDLDDLDANDGAAAFEEPDEIMDTGMVDFGEINFDDMTPSETPASNAISTDENDLGLDDFDFGDDMLTDLDNDFANFDVSDSDESPAVEVKHNDANYEATVIINRTSELEQEKLTKAMQAQQQDAHLSSLDDALSESTLMMDKDDPMADPFSATDELGKIHNDMASLGEGFDDPMFEAGSETSELENLLNDLDGLLDEDDKKK